MTGPERAAVSVLASGRARHIPPRSRIVDEGDRVGSVSLVMSGWLCCYRHLVNGRCQILTFLVAGDAAFRDTPAGGTVDYAVRTLGNCVVLDVAPDAMAEICHRHPGVARALASYDALQASIARERILTLGQRNAHERCAQLLCEMYWRLHAVGLVTQDGTLEFPLTQEEVGSAIGVSTVHANRMLQDLRKLGFISQSGRRLRVIDVEALQSFALFASGHLRSGPSPSVSAPSFRPAPGAAALRVVGLS